ncbi:OsmC family protein [Nocardioides hwasunensis]|uniref:OsmC family protein n=1 Tax=Nocardioides hwasunensis TaxID=397258 RepID=A0ABR8ME71_9ACTN|nr:OsmC family protein [Nocardioides hwasunensis]MBD3914412.1 OsmC family protein [Nocardioides hwasunensis]
MTDDTRDEDLRSVELTRIGPARFKATNARGGETFFGTGGEDPDFTPVELLLAAIAGCSALDVEAITHKRTTSTSFEVHAEGRKVRDEHGNHMTGLQVSFSLEFPEGAEGDTARERVQSAIAMSRDRLCTVSRTVQLGEDVVYPDVPR